MRSPAIYKTTQLDLLTNDTEPTIINDVERWVPAKSINYDGIDLFHRIKCAWRAFTGKADLLEWHR